MKEKVLTRFILLLLSFLLALPLSAMDFTIEALFTDKAMVKLNGKRILLKAGEEKKGLTLISSDTFAQTALIEIDGKREEYNLGRHIGGGYAKPEKTEVLINADRLGSYFVNGQINGRSVRFVVDTGASAVSMSGVQARRLGLNYKDVGRPVKVATAAGNEDAFMITLDEVAIGSISLNNVKGIVIPGKSPEVTLLGMTFLGQVELEQRQNLMVLRKKF